MPETVRVDEKNSVILVNSFHHVGADDLSKSLENVIQIVHDRGLNKVLVDATRQNSLPSTMSLHDFGVELSRRAKGVKHALIVADQTADDMMFIETVGKNLGLVIHIFFSRDDALSWLNQ